MSLSSNNFDFDSLAPPSIRRGPFTFEFGNLYAIMEDWTPGHIRADPKELYRLLRYTPPPKKRTKTGRVAKNQPKDTHVDPDHHYYGAQLIHYGLQPLKTRAASKKLLLSAFVDSVGDGMTLEVPDSILEIEAEMKAEWEILDAEYELKKREIQLRKKHATRQHNPQGIPSPSATEEAVLSIEERVAAVVKPNKPVNVPYKMTIAEMGAEIETLSLVQAREILTNLLGLHSSVRTVIQTEISSVKAKANGTASIESPVDPAVWTGVYDIEVPSLDQIAGTNFRFDSEDGRNPPGLTFEIYESSTSSHLWAAFQFGFLWGFMRSIDPAPKFLNTEIHFEYRGYEARGNMMVYDDARNRSVITFLPGGFLEGKIKSDLFKNFQIYGAHRGNTSVYRTIAQQHIAVKWWKKEYRRITANNFAVSKYSAWLASDGEMKDDQAFESDTTAGADSENRVAESLNKIFTEWNANADDDDEGNSGANLDEELRDFFNDCVE